MSAGPIIFRFAAAAMVWAGASTLSPATEPWPEPRPIAERIPAFRAPESPEAPQVVDEPAGPIRLQDALALALIGNPELQGFSWEVRAGEARELQAGKLANPEFSYRHYRLARQGGGDVGRARVVVTQEIELGGKRKRRAALASAERALSGWDYETRRVEVAALVAGRFASVLGAQLRVAAEDRLVAFYLEVAAKVAALVDAGRFGAIETHRVARRVGMARIDLEAAKTALAAARFALAATWGGREPVFERADGELDPAGTVPDLDSILELADNAPAIARWDAEIARAQAAIKLARAGRVPDMEYGVGVRREEGLDDDYLVDVEIQLPIFDRNQGGIREAQYGLARTQAGRVAARTQAAEQIAAAYFAVTESQSRSVTVDEQILPAARAIFEAYRQVFEQNATNLDDLLDARRDVARAEGDRIDALVDYRQNLAVLEGLVGDDFHSAP